MALSGTLSDLGIVDLIQFPHTGRKTGELVITGLDDECRCYYQKGKLVHVTCGEAVGVEAMVEIVSWLEGEFEFRLGVENDANTIETDLHRALMQALKLRDERVEAQKKEEHSEPGIPEKQIADILETFVTAAPFVLHTAVVANDGKVLAEAVGEDEQANVLEPVAKILVELLEKYPREGLSKFLVEDSLSITLAHKLPIGGSILLVAVSPDTSLGLATVNASKLLGKIEEVL